MEGKGRQGSLVHAAAPREPADAVRRGAADSCAPGDTPPVTP